MKIFITIVLILYSGLACSQNYEGDFVVHSFGTSAYNVTIRLVSLPYEGKTDSSASQLNRFGQAQNGTYHKHFQVDTFKYKHVNAYINKTGIGSIVDMVSCFGVEISGPGVIDSMWLFGKYYIKIEIPSTSEIYEFYFNALDSKYGANNIGGVGVRYTRDWGFFYHPTEPLGKRLIIQEGGGLGIYMDTVQAGIVEEFSVWKMIYNRDQPWERKFYARSTPFGIDTILARDTLVQREFVIGSTIILDTVYLHAGPNDKYGYNTDSLYYFSQSIPFNSPGNTYITPGEKKEFNLTFNKVYGIKIIAAPGDTMIMKRNKRLFVFGQGFGPQGEPRGDTLLFRPGSTLIREQNAEIFTHFGGIFIDSGANMNWSNDACFRAFSGTAMNFFGSSHTVNNGGYIKIDGNAHLNLGNNTVLTFDGANSYLQLDSNSNVKLGTNAKIVFKNGAYLKADKATFNTFNNVLWNGIELENAGSQTSITRCTFNNFKTAIRIENTNSTAPNNQRIIQNNKFNFTSGSEFGIFGKSIKTALIDNNEFNMSTITQAGVYIQQPMQTGEGAGGNENPASLNITNNRFKNTGTGIVLAGFTSANMHAFVKGNSTENSRIGILARKLSGDIKNNNINASSTQNGFGIMLTEANPDLFKNLISSYKYSIYNSSGSSPALAPYLPSESLIDWDAGQNVLTSTNYDVISFHSSTALLNRGENSINRTIAGTYQLYGQISGTGTILYAVNNCWTPYPPSYNLYNSSDPSQQIQLIHSQSPGFVCTHSTPYSFTVIDKGYGIYDTIFTTENGDTYNPDDDALMYGSANEEHENADYFTAITGYKNLIDNYTSSSYLLSALNNLYECHTYLDTFDTEEETDILYGSLKTYLEAKINSESYSSSFESEAYNIILSCESNMKNYEQAVEGYEFIALYHPDPEVRLLSSQDYAIIEDLLNGEGGSQSNKSSNLHNLSVFKK